MTPGNCIQITVADPGDRLHWIEYERMDFSGGEVQVRISDPLNALPTAIIANLHADLRSPTDVMELLLVTDALRRHAPRLMPINLVCPYLPYARQDRVCADGEALSLRVMCDIINSQGYSGVQVWDVHSPTAMALLDKAVNVPVQGLMSPRIAADSLLIAPDAGAVKRVEAVAKAFNRPMVVAEKHRDPNNGAISGTKCHIPEEFEGMDFLIVDDICDGGRTFIELAKVLPVWDRPSLNLWVTHGIFSKGFDELGQYFDTIFTPNPFHNELPSFVRNVRHG